MQKVTLRFAPSVQNASEEDEPLAHHSEAPSMTSSLPPALPLVGLQPFQWKHISIVILLDVNCISGSSESYITVPSKCFSQANF